MIIEFKKRTGLDVEGHEYSPPKSISIPIGE